ncbi:F420-0:gamma-glutamyl ligase [Allocatelliglobosispora scoriae]|uniref:F420-0:gamma-glutamyl ligase n=1 Tax=Allocatelliglobosispora scoriae TaxID=643052 RepID=A0A841BXP3_9ACTN|nr:coenzyme F420-0:L-glutamate ligase [Allocatelliglobosispora scoriae]MBB5871909.1 F420-0:gamma-glutamyl ligase [Allocatelliglobosispora scoriae]
MTVIVSDSFGSRNRDSTFEATIGIAGIRHMEELEGEHDLFDNPSRPIMNRVDEISSAASILMGQTDAALTVFVGHGITTTGDENVCLARLLVGLPLPEIDFDLRPVS